MDYNKLAKHMGKTYNLSPLEIKASRVASLDAGTLDIWLFIRNCKALSIYRDVNALRCS